MGYLEHYLGALHDLFMNETVIEVVINDNGHCFIESQGRSDMVRAADFDLSDQQVIDIATAAANETENKLSERAPLLSATVEYKSVMLRVQAVIKPASRAGAILSFRIFRPTASGKPKEFSFLREDVSVSQDKERHTLLEGVRDKARSGSVDDFLTLVLRNQLNTIISGGTSTGKTELGRRMLSLIEDHERLITIEDSFELRPTQPNTVSLIAERDEQSPRSAEKLLQATLRLRPDRIIVGELRGSEAATFIEAINTGHGGSFTTIHAQTARKAMDRLALMVMGRGTTLQYAEVLKYLGGTIDLVIQAGRVGNQRGIVEVYFPALENPM